MRVWILPSWSAGVSLPYIRLMVSMCRSVLLFVIISGEQCEKRWHEGGGNSELPSVSRIEFLCEERLATSVRDSCCPFVVSFMACCKL